MLVSFFLIIDIYFLIPASVTHTFNPIAKLLNKGKAEIQIQPVIIKTKISNCSM